MFTKFIKNCSYSLLSLLVPSLLMMFVIGYFARIFSQEDFGMFAIFFSLFGTASIFDFGFSRAVVRQVAIEEEIEEKKIILNTSLVAILVLSAFIVVLYFFCIKHVIVYYSEDDAHWIQYLTLAVLTLPAVLLNLILYSYLEGNQSFFRLSVIRSLHGVVISVFPLAFGLIDEKLYLVAVGVCISRYATLVLGYIAIYPFKVAKTPIFSMVKYRELYQFGVWVAVSSVIAPLMNYLDRFVLGYIGGVEKVAFYTGPAELVSRAMTFPIAIGKVFFSAIANGSENKIILLLGYLIMSLSGMAFVIFTWLFGKEIVYYWLGDGYLGETVTVLKVLSISFLFGCVAQIPFSMIHSLGASKVTAAIHAIELVPFLLGIYVLASLYGVVGVAFAVLLRSAVDCLLLHVLFLSIKKRNSNNSYYDFDGIVK